MDTILETFFDPILPVFFIMLVGFIMAKFSIFDDFAAKAINKFVFYAAMPALIFNLISRADFSGIDHRIILIYCLVEVSVFALGTALTRLYCKRSLSESLLLGMTACFVNHAFFILPIAAIIYGDKAVTLITVIIAIDTTVLFGSIITGLEVARANNSSIGTIGRALVYNPVLIAITLGLLVNLANIPLHNGIHTYTSFVGNAAAPTSLFCLGIILAKESGRFFDPAALSVILLKILIFPLIVLAAKAHLFGVDPILGNSLLMVASGPCGAMPFVLALQYRVPPESIGRAILYSTILSLFTLSIIV